MEEIISIIHIDLFNVTNVMEGCGAGVGRKVVKERYILIFHNEKSIDSFLKK